MKAIQTVKAKILLRKGKQELLRQKYQNWQRYLSGDRSVQLYSATEQQADRFLRRLKGRLNLVKEFPMILRRDTIKLDKKDSKFTNYWFRIPVSGRRGGIWVPSDPIVK